MSFVGWLIVAYIAWAVLSALRKAPAGKIASRAARRPPLSQAEAHRRLLETLGITQGERITVERPAASADRTAARLRRLPAASAEASSPEVTVDHDDEVERIVRKRRREVEARNHALAGDDYAAFEAKVRQEPQRPADEGRGTRDERAHLRKLMVWQEILGRPVGLRDP